MAEDQGKEEEKFDFTPELEGYISLDEARVLALQHARDNREVYGPYADAELVFEVVDAGETEDFYEVTLSFRPAGTFNGSPGSEQFVISKTGIIELRQVLESPIPDNPRANVGSGNGGGGGPLKWLLFGGFSAAVIVVIILVTVIATAGSSGNDGKQQPIAAPLPNIDKTIEAGIQQGLAARVVTVPPIDQTEPPTERSVPTTYKPVLPNPEPSSSTPTFSVAFANKWGTEGTGYGQFERAREVAVAPDGSVYVADWGNHRIQKFTSGGLFVRKWGTWAKGDGEFNYPAGVAVAPDGSVYVADASDP